MKILIVKRDKIGDMLLMTPLLTHLRSALPQAQIHVLANDYNAWVVEQHPAIDRLWVYPRFRHGNEKRWSAIWRIPYMNWQLRREQYDVAIAAGGVVSPRAIQKILPVRAKRTVAYVDDSLPAGLRAQLSDPVAYQKTLHEVESNLHLLSVIGVPRPVQPPEPYYMLPTQWLVHGKQWLQTRGLSKNGFVVIGINARRAKRKPSFEQIVNWAAWLYTTHNLATVFLWQPGETGNRLYPGDDARVEHWLKELPAYIHPLRSAESLMPVLGVIWHASTTIVPDGGLAHLSSVSPGGVLALFAETDVSPHPDNWRPYTNRSRYLEAKKSVTELTDQVIFASINELLKNSHDHSAPQTI